MELREKSESVEQLNQDVTLNSESTPAADADVVTENEAVASVVENDAENAVAPAASYAGKSKPELVEALRDLLEKPIDSIKDDVALIKVAFYSLRNAEIAALREDFLAKGNEEAAFAVPDDADEATFKEILAQIKEKRAEFNAAQEAIRAENLEKKRNIIAEINAIVADPDNIN
ncbi:MAG: DUF349 domain-containing protein, partial [Muribaculaceae bacterium]